MSSVLCVAGFLVKVRNAVLEPLLPGGPVHKVPFKKIIFANDVFFCAQHVKRLLLHDANMACGMDFAETHSEGMPGTHWVKPYGNEGPYMTVSAPLVAVCLSTVAGVLRRLTEMMQS